MHDIIFIQYKLLFSKKFSKQSDCIIVKPELAT